jgi:hypothetical protein
MRIHRTTIGPSFPYVAAPLPEAVLPPDEVFGTALKGWWKAEDNYSVATAPNFTLDFSGNSAHLRQGPIPPAVNATVMNGHPGWVFVDADVSGLITGVVGIGVSANLPMGTGTAGSFFCVFKMTSAAASYSRIMSLSLVTTGNDYDQSEGMLVLGRYGVEDKLVSGRLGNVGFVAPSIALNTIYRACVTWSGDTAVIYLDNVSVASFTTDVARAWGGNSYFALGNHTNYLNGGGAVPNSFDGAIGEAFVATVAADATQRGQIDAYLQERYA